MLSTGVVAILVFFLAGFIVPDVQEIVIGGLAAGLVFAVISGP